MYPRSACLTVVETQQQWWYDVHDRRGLTDPSFPTYKVSRRNYMHETTIKQQQQSSGEQTTIHRLQGYMILTRFLQSNTPRVPRIDRALQQYLTIIMWHEDNSPTTSSSISTTACTIKCTSKNACSPPVEHHVKRDEIASLSRHRVPAIRTEILRQLRLVLFDTLSLLAALHSTVATAPRLFAGLSGFAGGFRNILSGKGDRKRTPPVLGARSRHVTSRHVIRQRFVDSIVRDVMLSDNGIGNSEGGGSGAHERGA